MPDAQWRRAAAYVLCLDDAGRILLTRFVQEGNPDSGRWTMPGGGMEWGEHPIETAVRELEEETGLSADIGDVVTVWSQWFDAHETPRGAPGHVLGLVFAATNVRGTLREDFSDTTDAAGWFTVDEARALPHVPLVDACLDVAASRR